MCQGTLRGNSDFFCYNNQMSKKVSIFVAVFLVVLNFYAWQEVFILNVPKYLSVDFLAVGQGDSEFIETPEGHQILIDGGPNSTVLQKLAERMPFWDKDLDLVILSHPEKDHMQGLFDVLKQYKADYILWTGVKRTGSEYDEWLKVLDFQKNLGAKILTAKDSLDIKAGNVLIDTLFPVNSLEGFDVSKSANDTSIVNKIIYGNNSFLFTGDMSSNLENKIPGLKSDVLKVAHHGSKYSTSNLFLAGVAPSFATIEVGKNSYGHPTSEVLQRLENFGIKVFITDRDGDIEFISDGNNIYKK